MESIAVYVKVFEYKVVRSSYSVTYCPPKVGRRSSICVLLILRTCAKALRLPDACGRFASVILVGDCVTCVSCILYSVCC